jgi:hypothetical protein
MGCLQWRSFWQNVNTRGTGPFKPLATRLLIITLLYENGLDPCVGPISARASETTALKHTYVGDGA